MPPDITQPTHYPWSGTIVPWSAALRSKPAPGSRTLADVPRGKVVNVILRAQGWLYVELSLNGEKAVKGYVSRELIKPLPTASKTPLVQKTKADWQFIARQNAFGMKLAQQISNGTAWLPEKGFAASKQIIASVYDYYGALYRRNPRRFQWAGLARMAGGPFFKGFCDMEAMRAPAQAQLDWNEEHWILASFRARSPEANTMDLANTAIAGNLSHALKLLMEMGRDIFNDLAWQHEAYHAMGLAEIRRFVTLGVLPPGYASAWERINSENTDEVWAGNARLLQFEQQDILKKGYQSLQAMPLVPTGMSVMADSPHPWGKSFYEYYGKDIPWTDRYLPPVFVREVTRFTTRWEWLDKDIWPSWKRRTETERTRLINLPLKDLGDRKFGQ